MLEGRKRKLYSLENNPVEITYIQIKVATLFCAFY
jgi:hypothetical protein